MLLIVVVYILIYLKMKKQAQFRQRTASINSDTQMVQLSKTFTIVVLVYFICYLPSTISTVIIKYHLYSHMRIENSIGYSARTIFVCLLFSNSCMNPIIYSKVHIKIYNLVRQLILACRCRCPWNSFQSTSQKPPTTMPDSSSSAHRTNQGVMQPNQYVDNESAHVGPYNCEIEIKEIRSIVYSDEVVDDHDDNLEETAF